MKYFGGTFPVVNIGLSKLFRVGLKWRLMNLHFKNYVKKNIRHRPLSDLNKENLPQLFQQFKNRGFDKINIGGGLKNLKGFINVDFVSHPTVENEIVANILDLSFIPTSSLSHIHSNHVMEHLTPDQFSRQICEYQRILKPNGLLSIRCPNALGVCFGFWFGPVPERNHEEFLSLGFPNDDEFYNANDGWYYRDFYGLIHWLYADKGNIENEHMQILTPTVLRRAVEAGGFTILKMTDPETSNLVLLAQKKIC
jgi:SAM-dependent methyltransferase